MRPSAIVVLATGAVLALGSCTTSDAGAPGPTTTSATSGPTVSSPPASADNTYGAPRVDHPLDATTFLPNPCTVLTQAQLADFGVTEPGEADTEGPLGKDAPGCIWHADPEVNSSIDVSFLVSNKNGLSDTYRGKDRFDGYFEPTTVDSYPAVLSG